MRKVRKRVTREDKGIRICEIHGRPRPCSDCAAAGFGGSRGGGRPPELIDQVRVPVSLERSELEDIRKQFPSKSISGSIRAAACAGLAKAPETTEPTTTTTPAPATARKLHPVEFSSSEAQLLKLALEWHAYPHTQFEIGAEEFQIQDKGARAQIRVLAEREQWSDKGVRQLDLQACRLIRRALHQYQRSWKIRLEYQLRRYDDPEQGRPFLRQVARDENSKLLEIRRRIPWR